MKEIATVIIDNSDDRKDLYEMTLLAFNLIQRSVANGVGDFKLKEFWTDTDDCYTCYSNGIIDFNCYSDKPTDYHRLEKYPCREND